MGKKIPKESKFVEITKKSKATKVKSVDYYNGKSAYIVVQGTDEKENNLSFGCLRKRGYCSKEKSEGISEKEAIQRTIEQVGNESKESKSKPKEIMKVKLGFENDVPLWEVTYIDDDNVIVITILNLKMENF